MTNDRLDPELLSALARLEAHYRQDDRCRAMFLWGSAGDGSADEQSDLDVAMVVREGAYDAMVSGLRGTCEEVCGPIVAWLPEWEAEESCNYAFLFEAGERLLLCDFQVMTARAAARRQVRPGKVLFDHDGVLAGATESREGKPFTTEDLRRAIQSYWVYMYLNGKYLRRGDLYKLLYVQQVLLRSHLDVLNALEPEARWTWWARDAKRLSEEKRRELLVYFGSAGPASIAAALWLEADLFHGDALTACERHGIEYPQPLEDAVRRHLEDAS